MTRAITEWATWKEIHAQPQIWRRYATELAESAAELRAWVAASDCDVVWFSGAGTSAYIGDLIVAALGAHSDLPMQSVASTDLVAAPKQFLSEGKKRLVVSFGRSGNSAESIGVLNVLDALSPDTPRLNITCNSEGILATRPASNAVSDRPA